MPCKDLSDSDAGYIAGFMDGEGSIVLFLRANGSVGLILDLSNVVRAPIDWMIETTGAGYLASTRRRSEQHQTCYSWRVGGDAAESLLRKIAPMLKVKQRQAALAIEFQERLRTPKLKADRTWQADYRRRMKDLNARGRRAVELAAAAI